MSIENNIKITFSFSFKIDIIPDTNPASPITAIKGLGRGKRISMAKADNFIAIKIIKMRLKIAAALPDLVFGKKCIFMAFQTFLRYDINSSTRPKGISCS